MWGVRNLDQVAALWGVVEVVPADDRADDGG